MLDYTHTIYVNNNVTKLEPLSYIQVKEIIQQHAKSKNVFQTITLTALIVIIIIFILFISTKPFHTKLLLNLRNNQIAP